MIQGTVFYQEITNFNQCPVPDSERKRTDIFCTICSSLFAIILFIFACATFNNNNLVRMTYFLDGDGNLCGHDEIVKDYDLVYFTSINDPSKRLCVSKCPKAGDKALDCFPTSKLACAANTNPQFEVNIYDTLQEINRIGGICLPTDKTLYNKVFQYSQLQNKYTFLTIYDSIWTSLWVSIVLGIVYTILYQVMPRKFVHWKYIIGAVIFFAIGITILAASDGFILFKIIGALFLILIGALIAFTVIKQEFRRQIFICGRLYQIAAQIVKDNPLILLSILVWQVFFIGLLALTGFEILSCWSTGPLVYKPEKPFLENTSFGSNLFSFFIFLQFIWGLAFLKEAFNFCVSGYATSWYCFKQNNPGQIQIFSSFKRLIKFHWGSVVGGSLLLWSLYIFDLVIDFFFSSDSTISADQSKSRHPKPFTREVVDRRGVLGFFDLVRSESFGYINLIPIPYCNASRYCEMMADDSNFYDRSQTTNRLYRIVAHATLIMIATLIALNSNKHTDNNPNLIGIIFVAIVSYFTCTYFIGFYGDLAEGILISIFVEQRLSLNGQPMNINGLIQRTTTQLERPPQIVNDLYKDDLKDIYQNNSIIEYLKGHKDQESAKPDLV